MAKASINGGRRTTAVDAHVGQKIRTRRNLLGLSQTELADAAGITFQQVQKYEKGANRVGAGRLMQFSEALGVPPSYFFEGAPTVGKKAPAPSEGVLSEHTIVSFLGTREGAALVRAFMAVKQKPVRQNVITFIETLTGKWSSNLTKADRSREATLRSDRRFVGWFDRGKGSAAISLTHLPVAWSIEESSACFIVRDGDKQALAYVYYENESGRRSSAKLLTSDEAFPIAVNIAKPPSVPRQILKDIPRSPNSASRDDWPPKRHGHERKAGLGAGRSFLLR
jgi:transcriptional regulator with XRE-family HTH domain